MIDPRGVIRDILARITRQSASMDFWSPVTAEVLVDTAHADVDLGDVTVAGIPTGSTIIRVIAMFKFRAVENDNGAANSLDGAQEIQVQKAAEGWNDAINFVDTQCSLPLTSGQLGGDVFFGYTNLSAICTGNDTYHAMWDEPLAHLDHIYFRDVQWGLRFWYR